jgi:hypothetical protein
VGEIAIFHSTKDGIFFLLICLTDPALFLTFHEVVFPGEVSVPFAPILPMPGSDPAVGQLRQHHHE